MPVSETVCKTCGDRRRLWLPATNLFVVCTRCPDLCRDHQVLLYDRERYGGDRPAPGYQKGMIRWALNAYSRRPGRTFYGPIWTASAETYESLLTLVPPGGQYFNRELNYPSPMVPIEGWFFDAAPEPPREVQRAAE